MQGYDKINLAPSDFEYSSQKLFDLFHIFFIQILGFCLYSRCYILK